MCGIAGLANVADPRETERLLTAMAESMEHRGPDDQGVAVVDEAERAIGLCARRLAIQDCSPKGHQPMRSAATGRWVALNGEIYNVAELRATLERAGHSFHGHSDTEVLLHAFDEWGMNCLERLRGMFAFAVWDAPERRLLVVRDRLGIKPIYLWQRDGMFVFASEVRTLLESGVVEKRLSPAGLSSYLSLGGVQDPHTLLEGVHGLPAGHWAQWKDGELTTGAYWTLDGAFGERDRTITREQAVQELRAELEEAVRLHLVSDVPLGVFLSGGIDSSALVGLVSHVADAPPRTISVVFPEQEYSEAPYIQQVRDRFDTDHTEVLVDHDAVLADVPEAVGAMDLPTFDGVNTHIVSGAAKRSGLTVALSGLGGDELFGGYATFRDVPRMRRIRSALPAPAGRVAAAALQRVGGGHDRQDKLARWLRGAETERSAYALRRELFSPEACAELLARPAAEAAVWELPRTVGDEINDVSILELGVYMRNVLLRDSDVMSMAHSLEIRVPLIDHVLVERVARLDGGWKDGRGTPKALMVDALADLLPHEVVHRRKMGFTLPWEHWLRGPLRPRVERALTDPDYGGEVARHLDPAAVRAIWTRFLDGKAIWVRPWSLFVVKEWGERNLPLAAAARDAA